jgi:transposase
MDQCYHAYSQHCVEVHGADTESYGQPPYHPRMMTKILLYGYCVGVFSSRKIQKHLVEDVAFRVLAAGNQPDFRTISDYRKLHLPYYREELIGLWVIEAILDSMCYDALLKGVFDATIERESRREINC